MSKSLPISPLAPTQPQTLPPIRGVRLAVGQAGIKHQNRNDVLLIELAPGTAAAGVFTRSLTRAAPVDWCEEALLHSRGQARAIIVNSGNANAFTGQAGIQTVRDTVVGAAKVMGVHTREVLMASTGVIGQPLDANKITTQLPNIIQNLDENSWAEAARAIMTTDTFAKLSTRQAMIADETVTINGIAKGSGMIAPDMATMLGFICTDAAVPPTILKKLLNEINEISFNAITVDGDTSTNDCIILAATGAAQNRVPKNANDPLLRDFQRALTEIMLDLAHQVVRDGEGAQKFIAIRVTGARNQAEAKKIAMAIGNSPLIKTAIAGGDANWGRIVMAIGKSGAYAERDRLKISIGGTLIAANGMAVMGYDEAPVTQHINGREIDIAVDLSLGRGAFTAWTCDLTHGYIAINADYRS